MSQITLTARGPFSLAASTRFLESFTPAASVQRIYDLSETSSVEAIERRAEAWRPYRTWATVLLRTSLEEATGEIAGPRRRSA